MEEYFRNLGKGERTTRSDQSLSGVISVNEQKADPSGIRLFYEMAERVPSVVQRGFMKPQKTLRPNPTALF